MLLSTAHAAAAVASWLSRAAAALAALAALCCFGLVCYVVVSRYIFGGAPNWSDEAVGWLIVASVMLAIGEAQRRGEHIGVDLLLERVSGARHRAMKAFGALCVAASAVILVWQGWEMVAFSQMIGAKALAIDTVPLWVVQAMIPIGGALMLLVSLAQLIGLAAGIDTVPEPTEIPKATE